MITQLLEKKPGYKLSPSLRGNFSQCGKLIDQVFYIESKTINSLLTSIEIEYNTRKSPKKSTIAFTSVSREKKPNIRTTLGENSGEFKHQPNYMYGRNKSPQWSFPKKQKYPNAKHKQYQICQKHPLITKQIIQLKQKISHTPLLDNHSSIYQKKNKIHKKKTLSFSQTCDGSRNYSIVLPRKISVVDFFSKTKIKKALYLTKQQLLNGQQSLQSLQTVQTKPKGYIQFSKKKPHQPLKIVKGFQPFLSSYTHQHQFNNYKITKFPTQPTLATNFSKQQRRGFETKDTRGPNLQQININITRINRKNTYLDTGKFIDKIKNRLDRAQPQPSMRLEYDIDVPKLGRDIKMEKMLARPGNLFSMVVNPRVKKVGDGEIMEKLKQCICQKEINEAMNPNIQGKISM